jgi:thiamine biosynthesis lipoprotein
MKKILIISFLILLSCGSSKQNKILVSNYGYSQGTTYSIRYMSKNAMDYQNQIDSVLLEVDLSMSTYIPESLISKINRNESNKIDSLFFRVLTEALLIAEETQGAFDPTLAPIVNYWGFGFEEIEQKDSLKFRELMLTVGYESLIISDSILIKTNSSTQIDFNAIAQGFTVDLVGEHLTKLGITNYMIEIGGELKCNGLNADGELWRIGIDKPSESIQKDRFQAIIEVDNKSVASSGNYRKFKVDEETGLKYAHTINPITGRPVHTNLLGVTIITESCMKADAIATACMVMGLEKSKSYLEKHPEIDALFIYSDPKGKWLQYQTEGFEKISVYSSN